MRTPRPLLLLVLSAGILMSGCISSKFGEPVTPVNYYPQCYQPIADLRADENKVAKSTAAGAAGGALTGAAVGGLATGNWKGAVAGAAVGGATGAVAGNVYGKQQQAERDAEYMARYAQMLDEDTASMNRTTAAAKVASQCYNNEFKKAINDFKAKRIGREELQARYEEIRAGLKEISYVLNQRYDAMVKKDEEYQAALATEFTEAPRKAPKKASAAKQKTIAYKASKRFESMDANRQLVAANELQERENEALIASALSTVDL